VDPTNRLAVLQFYGLDMINYLVVFFGLDLTNRLAIVLGHALGLTYMSNFSDDSRSSTLASSMLSCSSN
jgi:hypothetical protein